MLTGVPVLALVPAERAHLLVLHPPEAVDDVVPDGHAALRVEPSGGHKRDAAEAAVGLLPQVAHEVVRLLRPSAKKRKEGGGGDLGQVDNGDSYTRRLSRVAVQRSFKKQL